MPFPAPQPFNLAAELMRVESTLQQAGFNLRATHGMSDSGDPWVALSDPETNDVLIHVELVDGRVVASGPAFIRIDKLNEMTSGVCRILHRLREQNRRQSNGSHLVLSIAVALAIAHIADVDAIAAAIRTIDGDDIAVAPLTKTVAVIALVEKVVQAVTELSDLSSIKPITPIEPFQPEQSSSLWDTQELVHIRSARIDVDNTELAQIPAVTISVKQDNEAAVSAPIRLIVPQEKHDHIAVEGAAPAPEIPWTEVGGEVARDIIVAFREQSDALSVYRDGETIVVYGEGGESTHHLVFSDGSRVKLIGVEDMPEVDMSAWEFA